MSDRSKDATRIIWLKREIEHLRRIIRSGQDRNGLALEALCKYQNELEEINGKIKANSQRLSKSSPI